MPAQGKWQIIYTLTPCNPHQNKERYNCWTCKVFKKAQRLWVINLFLCLTYQCFSVVLTSMLVTLRNWNTPRWFYCAARAGNAALKPSSALWFSDKLPFHLSFLSSPHICISLTTKQPFTRTWKLCDIFLSHSLFCPQNWKAMLP